MAERTEYSRISPLAIALTFGLLWGMVMFVIGTANYLFPPYGEDLLRSMDSVYPGAFRGQGFAKVLIGGAFGLVDAFFAGAIVAWVYNAMLGVLRK